MGKYYTEKKIKKKPGPKLAPGKKFLIVIRTSPEKYNKIIRGTTSQERARILLNAIKNNNRRGNK